MAQRESLPELLGKHKMPSAAHFVRTQMSDSLAEQSRALVTGLLRDGKVDDAAALQALRKFHAQRSILEDEELAVPSRGVGRSVVAFAQPQ